MTFDKIVEDWRTKYKQQFGADADTSEKSIAYMLNYPILYALYELYSQRQADIDATNIYKASGTYLDNLLGNYMFTRKTAKQAYVTLTSTDSTPGTVIGVGNLLVRAGEIEFVNVSAGTVDSSGNVSLKMQALVAGTSGNIDAGTLTDIVTPLAGVGTVTNTNAGYGGQNLETDYEYRQRFLLAPNGDSFWNMAGLKKALMEIDGVASVYVRENATNITVLNMPPHSIKIVVDGGAVEAIATTIYERTPYETTKLGDVEVSVFDEVLAESKTIKFSRPTDVLISYTASFEGIVDEVALHAAIVSYINSTPVGGSISSFKAVNYVGTTTNLENLNYLDIQFVRDTEPLTYITLEATEKAKAVIV